MLVRKSEPIPGQRGSWSNVDWGAILVSVLVGFGLTLLLVTIGAAAGAMAPDGDTSKDDAGKIAAAVGAWTLIAAVAATFIGSFVGGRFSSFLSRGFAIYHALAAWGLSLLIGAWLGASGISGLLGSGLTAAANRPAQAQQAGQGASGNEAANVADAIGMGGWALALGMLLTLAAAIAGWWLGSRKSLFSYETDGAGAARGEQVTNY